MPFPEIQVDIEEIPLFRRNKAAVNRLTEKQYYRALANSNELPDRIRAFKNITTYQDGRPLSKEDNYKLGLISASLEILHSDWKKYTESYLIDTGKKKHAQEEIQNALRFKQSLDQCMDDLHAMELNPISDQEPFSAVLSFLNNLQGHYEEMTNGSLKKVKGVRKDNPSIEGINETEALQGMLDRFHWEDHKNDPLFPHEPCVEDIRQGALGDCYFLSAITSVVANNPQAIRDMFHDNGDGTVTVRLYEESSSGFDFQPKYITVDKTTPVIDKTSSKTGDLFSQNALWVQMLEKAFAASGIHNSGSGYHKIEGGHAHKAIKAILGPYHVKDKDLTNETPDNQFRKIKEALQDGHFITCSTSGFTNIPEKFTHEYHKILRVTEEQNVGTLEFRKSMAEKKAFMGLRVKEKNGSFRLADHAYSVVGAETVNGKNYVVVREPNATVDTDFNNHVSLIDKEGKVAAGYLAFPIEDFHRLFDKVHAIKPLTSRLAEDPTKEIGLLANEIFEGLAESRSASQKVSMVFASDDFKDLYKAAKELRELSKQNFPSKTRVTAAVEKLTAASQKYYEARKDEPTTDADRNLRMTLAKAGMQMKEIFENRKDESCPRRIREVEEEMLQTRIAFVLNRGGKNGPIGIKPEDVAQDKNLGLFVSRLKEKDLLQLALHTKVEKFGKAMLEKDAAIKNQDKRDQELRAADQAAKQKKNDGPKPVPR